jgi:hypothetical protein
MRSFDVLRICPVYGSSQKGAAMTAEPQQGYRATEEDLSCLNDYIDALWRRDESIETIYRLIRQEIEVIRSRPLTKAPEPITTVNDMERGKSRLVPDGSTSAPGREESRHVGRNCDGHDKAPEGFVSIEDPNCPLYQAVHDAQVARAATLAEDQKWIDVLNTLITTESVRSAPAMVNVVYSYRIAQIIESLRTQEPPK